MKKIVSALPLIALLTACGNDGLNPLNGPAAPDPEDGLELPPGTTEPTASGSIKRYEEEDGDGNGFAQDITYDDVNDRFYVDNLGFDGDNFYSRDNQIANLGPFQVYENTNPVADDVTGTLISQFPHKAIYGESTTGNTKFAVVRTGAYVDYGFGGFVYERSGGVSLPTTGQAAYTGAYAALRDFKGNGGTEYVVGTMSIDIDFRDFNSGNAVQGAIRNRLITTTTGVSLNSSILDAIEEKHGIRPAVLPVLNFVVGPGVIDANGEITGGINSYVATDTGGLEIHADGKYYAVISGAGADQEITGIVVVEGDDPRADGVKARETGGFIVYR